MLRNIQKQPKGQDLVCPHPNMPTIPLKPIFYANTSFGNWAKANIAIIV